MKERTFDAGQTRHRGGQGRHRLLRHRGRHGEGVHRRQGRAHVRAGRLLRRDRARRGHGPHGDDQGRERASLLRHDVLGLPPARRVERVDRLEDAPGDGAAAQGSRSRGSGGTRRFRPGLSRRARRIRSGSTSRGPSASRASGRSTERPGKGVRVCILDSGVEPDHPKVGEVAGRGRDHRRRGRQSRREPDERGRPLRPRHRVRGNHPRARAGVRDPQRPRARRRLHGLRADPARRPALGRRAGLRRDQHEPLDDEAPVRRGAARARRQGVLQPDDPRRVGAQHAGRELPVALLVGHLRRQPRRARLAALLLQPEPAGRVLRARRRRRARLDGRHDDPRDGQQLRDAAHRRASARSCARSTRS